MSDFKDFNGAWLSEFDCLAIARHDGSAENHTGLKVWKMKDRRSFASYFHAYSFGDRLIATSGGPVLIQLSDGDTAESVKTDPILAYDPSDIAANNLAFNWKYDNNGARVVLTDKGHYYDDCHGLGNVFTTTSGNDIDNNYWHDASIIQGDCWGTCKAQGTDFGKELTPTAKLGSYAFYVADMEAGKCPAGW